MTTCEGQVLVLDSDHSDCQVLENVIQSCGLLSKIVHEASTALESIEGGTHDIVFLDLVMAKALGQDIISKIRSKSPHANIILIAGCDEADKLGNLLKKGASDFIEKPITAEIACFALRRALNDLQKEHRIQQLSSEANCMQAELNAQKGVMDRLTCKLIEITGAMSVTNQVLRSECDHAEKIMGLKLKKVVCPHIEKIRNTQSFDAHATELATVSYIIDNFIATSIKDSNIIAKLTPAELKVASLIKAGFNTDEIAKQLFVSPSTIRTHRKNIRRKLGINKSRCRLKDFLEDK